MNGGTTMNVDVSVKKIIYVKKIISGVLLHVIMNMEYFQQVLWMILYYMWNYDEETNFNGKKKPAKFI